MFGYDLKLQLGGNIMSDNTQKSVLEIKGDSFVQLTLHIGEKEFEGAVQQAYLKNRNKLNFPGFRKGRVPRAMVEKQYGKDFFHSDALEFCFQDAFDDACLEHDVDVVSRPDVTKFEASEGGGAEIVVEVFVRPVIEVKDYKGLEYTLRDDDATDDEVMTHIERERERNARIVSVDDRPAKNGDTVVFDFAGYMDGVAFAGGTAQGHELVLGSGSFIEGFEEQIEGKNIDEEFDVNVNFPEAYHAPELAGKPAVFKCKLIEIKQRELPEIDDMFAQEISEFDTLDEYKADLKAKMSERKAEYNKLEIENELADALADKVNDFIPTAMIEAETRRLISLFAESIERQGMDFERYLQMTGQGIDAVVSMYQEPAFKNVKGRLAVDAIVRQENITLTQEEYDAEIERLVTLYEMPMEEFLRAVGNEGLTSIEKDLKGKKALSLIREHAVGKEFGEKESASEK